MKPYSATRRQSGFTLVEIAIVLMIVGLLIGGILRGQELIQSARVRNIIDQKSAIQTAYVGFLDRYRMLPGDLNAAQAATVGNGAVPSTGAGGQNGANAPGNGLIGFNSEAVLFFQNLTAAGFLSCGACMTVAANGGSNVTNSPINVYGAFLNAGNLDSVNVGNGSWLDAAAGINRLIISTGATVPSQVLAEVDRKADDGLPGTGQLRFYETGASSGPAVTCAPTTDGIVVHGAWANPSQSNCEAAWLF